MNVFVELFCYLVQGSVLLIGLSNDGGG